MKNSQATTIELSVTDRVNIYNWKGLSRFELTETTGTTLQVSGIDTEELILAISYLVRNLTQDVERGETITRRLGDIANDLKALTKVEA